MDIAQLWQQLRTDKTSGSTTLLERALDILEHFAHQPLPPNVHTWHTTLAELVTALITAQPTMAVMINLGQHVLQACAVARTPTAAQRRLRRTVSTLRQRLRQSTVHICQHTLALLPPQAVVLTYSNSATVVAALHYAFAHGRLQRVYLSESRPAYDGQPQAHALLTRGIPVEYSIDMGLFERLPEANVVLVGADAVFPHALVNKLGTTALAHMARHYAVPIFSLCASNKFLPAAAAPLLRIVDHPAQEVWPAAPPGLSIRNRYFEATPLELFHGIVCEHGLFPPAVLSPFLQRQRLAPLLQRLASEGTASDDHSDLPAHRTLL